MKCLLRVPLIEGGCVPLGRRGSHENRRRTDGNGDNLALSFAAGEANRGLAFEQKSAQLCAIGNWEEPRFAMADQLRRDTLFMALTRPQMFAGVTYTFFVINAVIAVELFLIFRAWWVLLVALVIHGVGVLACLREPRFFDLWITRMRTCPRVRNHDLWQCNSYRP